MSPVFVSRRVYNERISYRHFLLLCVPLLLSGFSLASAGLATEAETYFSRGNDYYAKGLYDEAISEYSKAILINPGYAEAYKMCGDAYYRKGLYSEAVNDYDRVTPMSSDFVIVYYNKALALEHLGQREEAVNSYLFFVQHAASEQSIYVDIAKRRIKALGR
jgi:tetratricopeptide (TPR) repeat protein